MLKINGGERPHSLKKDPKLKAIPVIIYTASKLPEDKEKTKRLGSNYFITKLDYMNDSKKS